MLALTQAFATGQLRLSGEESTLGSLVLPAQRTPDDAPRWVSGSRVSLESLNGGLPIRVNDSKPWNLYLRLAPDLDYGAERDDYLHLAFSNDAQALDPASSLSIRLNGAYAAGLPLRAGRAGQPFQQANVYLGNLPSSEFGNTLQAQFLFIAPGADQCSDTHASGTLGSGSYLDLGTPSHLAKLPNLRLFSMAGFPFTRFADLGQTAILLPEHSTAGEITLYLNMLGYFGEQTGYPALRVQVGDQKDAAQYGNKDILLVGTYGDLSNVPRINTNLPFQLQGNKWSLSTRARVTEIFRNWWNTIRGEAADSSSTDGELTPDGTIEQMRSPFSPDRNLTVLLGRDAAALDSMTAALMNELPDGGLNGSVSLWQGGKFENHFYGTSIYYVGGSKFLERVKRLILEYQIVLALGLITAVVLMAYWLNGCIWYRIQQRLMDVEFDLDGNPNSPAPRQGIAGTGAL